MNPGESQSSVALTHEGKNKNQSEKVVYYLSYSSAYFRLHSKSFFCPRIFIPSESPREVFIWINSNSSLSQGNLQKCELCVTEFICVNSQEAWHRKKLNITGIHFIASNSLFYQFLHIY